MDRLNSDCLVKIFLLLDFNEKVKLEAVCKRWRRILQTPYPYSDITRLNAAEFTLNSPSGYYQQDNINFCPTMLGILERCGPYLREITFGSRWLRITQPIVDHMSRFCLQLTSLDLGCVILNADISPVLEKVAHQLEYFSLEETSWMDEQSSQKVGRYFSRMRKIKSINLRRTIFSIENIVDLPTDLESIDLSGGRNLSSEGLSYFILTHPHLKELRLCPINGGLNPFHEGLKMVIECLGSLSELETLTLGYINHDGYSLPMHNLAKLRKVKNLQLKECNAMNASTLEQILEAMNQLETLSLINCMKINDFTSLGLCKNLTQLEIEKTTQICDDDIELLAQNRRLKVLRLRRTLNISNKSIFTITRLCPLKILEIVGCEHIDNKCLEDLSETKLKLETLSFNACGAVTGQGIKSLTAAKSIMKNLKDMDLSYNKNIDNEAIRCLKKRLRLCRKIRKQPLTIYVFQTGVSRDLESEVAEEITLIF